MRTVVASLMACLAWLVPFQAIDDDAKQEKERQERLEKRLAEYEREMEEWVVKVKRSNAELARLLDQAEQIDLFRLDHRPLPVGNKDKKKEFRGYEILSEVRINAKEKRKEASAFLGKTLHWNDLLMADCFHPRHGLRAVSEKRTLDFLICFECHRIQVFEGEKKLAHLPTGFIDKKNPIERFLTENEKKSYEQK